MSVDYKKKTQGYVKGKTEKPQDYRKDETNTKIREGYGKEECKNTKGKKGEIRVRVRQG